MAVTAGPGAAVGVARRVGSALAAGLVLGVGLLLAVGSVTGGAAAAATPAGEAARAEPPRVLVSRISATITPVTAGHLVEGIERAGSGGYAAYVIELDTPGGLGTSMGEVVRATLAAPVPVIVHVTPAGGRAGSAGAIITYAAHVAAMAPGTTIGSATPVGGGGGEDLDRKIVEDAAAQAEALARLRERDVDFARASVTEGRSVPVAEAVRIGAVDFQAASLAEVLQRADGRTVRIGSAGTPTTVRTADAAVERFDPSALRRLLQWLADPNVAFLLMSLGTLGLIYELASPGVGVAGATGAVLLVLGMFGVAILPVRAAGVALLVLAAVLFLAEVLAPGFAGFGAGGGIVLVLSGLLLFDTTEGVGVHPATVVPTAAALTLGAILAGRLVLRSRHAQPVISGAEGLLGQLVRVRISGDGAGGGRGFVEGSWWNVRGTGGALRDGALHRVVGLDGLTLLAEPADPAGADGTTAPPEGK